MHVSAMSADSQSSSLWSQSKAKGEEAVRKHFPEAIIVRPATVFGPEDRFLNWIAELNSRLPFFPLLDGGAGLVQPVYAVDVAKALMQILNAYKEFEGKTFQLAGPAEYSYKEVIEFVSDVTGVKKPLIDVPPALAVTTGRILEQTIAPFWTTDMVAQLREDNVLRVDEELLTFKDLDMQPSSIDKEAFDFLHRFRPGGHFTLVKGYH
mmetsp:Transcript_7640/g.11414  ORF Transcript_7640/g.11414 Transcript_7640/m.11414 type:complete len:208 (-) Transcript_7640:74-697(-)